MSRYLSRVVITETTCPNCDADRPCASDGVRDPLCSPCLSAELAHARAHLTSEEIGRAYPRWMRRAQIALARLAR